MIKINQLLKESLATYKKNVGNIVYISLPILAAALLQMYANYGLSNNIGANAIFVIALALFFVNISMALFFQPAVFRSLQKLDDTNSFDIKASYNFQKKNVWNLIVLYIMATVFSIYKVWKLFIAFFAFVGAAVYFLFQENVAVAIALFVIAVAILLAMLILNAPRFVLYQNVFFSNGGKPKDAVLESISLGEAKTEDAWKIIFTSILFSLYIVIATAILVGIGWVTGMVGLDDLVRFVDEKAMPTDTVMFFEFALTAVSTLFVVPVGYLILAKGYNKIKETPSESNPQ